jgi:hypothetical protein
MTVASVGPIEGRIFRAGTAFELVVFDRLPREEQAALSELKTDPDFYGILRPRLGNGQTIKLVNKDTALLWLTLQSPGPLPFFVFGNAPEAATSPVWQLVLDGVLEIEERGRFVAGSEAADLLYNGRRPAPQGRLAMLSRSAMQYAERTRIQDASQLATWLYRFGSQPISPRWVKRLPDADAVLDFVGAGQGTALRRTLDSRWNAASAEPPGGWLVWSSRDRDHVPPDRPDLQAVCQSAS